MSAANASPSHACDAMVIGGGPAGVSAAIQAARAGLDTLLIERGSTLGGTTTVGGVNYPGLFHAWGRQVIRGYGWGIVERCMRECGDELPDFSVVPERHWMHQVKVNRFVFAMLCDEAVQEAGCRLRLHTMPAALEATDDGWRVTLCDKAGLSAVHARFVIDCTGDANAVALAGGELRVSSETHQPGTQVCRISGYDLAELDLPSIDAALAEAVERGGVHPHDVGWASSEPSIEGFLKKHGENANHVPGINARDSAGRTAIELAGRGAVLRVFRFLKKQPGLDNLTLEPLQASVWVDAGRGCRSRAARWK